MVIAMPTKEDGKDGPPEDVTQVKEEHPIVQWARRIHLGQQFVAGTTVALAMIPEAIAFAFVAGVPPGLGLSAAWLMCLTTCLIGGQPGQISGATGSTSVILAILVADKKKQYEDAGDPWETAQDKAAVYLFYAVMFCGVLHMVAAACQVHKVLRLVTLPVKIGFLDGLAIVIAMSQKGSFQLPITDDDTGKKTFEWIDDGGKIAWMIFLSVVTIAVNLSPFEKIPLALTSIVVATVLEHLLIRLICGGATTLVVDLATVNAGVPEMFWFDSRYGRRCVDTPVERCYSYLPDFDGHLIQDCASTAIFMTLINITETLLTTQKLDTMMEANGNPMIEVFAHGFANVVAGFFGTMGGGAMIGQSMINVSNGGTHRISGIWAGVFMFLITIVIGKPVEIVPISAFAGVMFAVAYFTFEKKTPLLFMHAFFPKGTGNKKIDRFFEYSEPGLDGSPVDSNGARVLSSPPTTPGPTGQKISGDLHGRDTIQSSEAIASTAMNASTATFASRLPNLHSNSPSVVNPVGVEGVHRTADKSPSEEGRYQNDGRSTPSFRELENTSSCTGFHVEGSHSSAVEDVQIDFPSTSWTMNGEADFVSAESINSESGADAPNLVQRPSVQALRLTGNLGARPSPRGPSEYSMTPGGTMRRKSKSGGLPSPGTATPSRRSLLTVEAEDNIEEGKTKLTRLGCLWVVVVSVLTIVFNLAIGVGAGLFLSNVEFWIMRKYYKDEELEPYFPEQFEELRRWSTVVQKEDEKKIEAKEAQTPSFGDLAMEQVDNRQ